jgi:Zn-dependent membrane protease YugP
MFYFDPVHMLIGVVGVVLSLWAQAKVKGAYAKWSQVPARSGLTGADVARKMMQDEAIYDVQLECIEGQMTDHYDPKGKIVNLSHDVYYGHSIAALGIAAHEVGHVIQHARGYAPMQLRNVIYPVSALGSNLGMILIMAGLFLSVAFNASGMIVLAKAGIWLFAAAVAFTLITLPVEFDASRRAKLALAHGGVLDTEEMYGVRKVLGAAAMTYVAAAAVAVMELLYWVMQVNRRD